MKRIIALVLSLVMSLSLCAPAWATGEVPVADTAELKTALASASSGGIIKLAADTTYDLTTAIPEGVTLEGAGESTVLNLGAAQYKISKNNVTIKNVTIKDEVNSSKLGEALLVEGVNVTLESVNYTSVNKIAISLRNTKTADNTFTLRDSTLSSTARGIGLCYFAGTILVEGSVIDSGNSIHIDVGGNTAKIIVKDSTLYGNVAAGATASFEFEDVTFEVSKLNGSPYNGVSSYSTAAPRTFKECTFTSATDISMNNVTAAITLVDCNLNGTPITAENITTLMPGNYAAANVTVNGDVVAPVATADGVPFKTLQEALTAGGKVVLLDNITLTEGVTVASGKTVELDLAGYEISGTDTTTGYDALIHVNNGAKLTIKDSSTAGTGKITYTASGSGIQGATIWVEGDLLLESGTIDLGGSWSLGFTVDVRPNAWGTAYSVPATFTMNNGTLLSTDTAVRVGSNSSDSYEDLGVSFTMNNGKIDSTWDSIFIHHLYADTLNITVNKGVVSGDNSALRIFGDVKSDVNVSIVGGDFTGDLKNLEAKGEGNIAISGGYFTADPSDYCADKLTGVASDKAGYLYMVGEKGANPAEVEVAAPEVAVDTSKMTDTEATIANSLKENDAIELDTGALKAEATDIANDNTVTKEQGEEKLKAANITVNPSDEVAIVVQPYFDVEIKDVIVVEESGAAVSSVTIQLDITPMYQTVATTQSVLDNNNTEIKTEGDGQNAVVIGTAKEMTVTEPVTITIKIPAALVTLAGTEKKLFVTHEASSGTYVYEATVDTQASTATFTNPHGFSSFSIGATDNTVAKVGSDKYTNLQDAINNAGKDAVITVVKGNNTAVVKGEISFTVVLETGATASISAGSGYTMTKEDVTGGVKYTFTKVTTGGYYPYYPPTTTPDSELVKSAETFDAGVAMYVAVSVMGAIGTVALGKKRED